MKVQKIVTEHPLCCTPEIRLQEIAAVMAENDAAVFRC